MSGWNRAEWIAIAALALNLLTIVFTAGIVWATQEDHERRIAEQEQKMDTLGPKVERIDANVSFLTDLAREERNRKESR